MSEDTQNEQGQADIQPEQEEIETPKYEFQAEDAGSLKKKISVTVSRERINEKLGEMFGELGQSAQVPGFRIGHAPRRLVEKRFGKEVSQDVRNSLVGESLGQVLDDAEFKTLGEPDIDLEAIELPEAGDMVYSFEVEVAPEFELPELSGITVEKSTEGASDEHIDKYMAELCESRATFEASDEAAAEGDMVTADTLVSGDDLDDHIEGKDQTLRVAPGQIEGLPLVDLGTELTGKKAGETATLTVEVPAAYPNEQWRGKQATVAVEIKEVKKRNVPELNEEMAKGMGFDSIAELREFFADRVRQRVEAAGQQALRDQICKYLLDSTTFDLPEGVAARQAAGALQRRYVDLLRQGVPREQIDENITELKAAVEKQSADTLKLQFIVGKIAEDQSITVEDDEVNSRIAQMAAMYGRRPERIRQELEQDGTISQLHGQLIEEKVISKLLEDAKITEVAPAEAKSKEDGAKKAAKKTAKKAAKKTAKKTEEKAEEKKTEKKAAKKTAKKAAKKSTDKGK